MFCIYIEYICCLTYFELIGFATPGVTFWNFNVIASTYTDCVL